MGIFTGSGKDEDKRDIDPNQEEFEKSLRKAEETFKDIVSSTNSIASELANRSLDFWGWAKSTDLSPLTSLWGDEAKSKLDDPAKLIGELDRFFPFASGSLDEWIPSFRRFHESGLHKVTPYGMWAYPVPSAKLYKECLEKQGLSAWDERGYWRCLFPRASIPLTSDEPVLTREDVEQDSEHRNGRFFTQFTDYLDWKGKMLENMREERKKRWAQKREEWLKYRDEERKKWDGVIAEPEAPKVTGSSSSYSYRTLPDGTSEKVSKTQEWFADGTSKIKEKKTVIDADGKENVSEFVKSLNSSGKEIGDSSKGWFWDSSEK